VRPHHVKCSNHEQFMTPCRYSAATLRDWTVWSAVSIKVNEGSCTHPCGDAQVKCGRVQGDSPSVSTVQGYRRAVWEEIWECGFLVEAKLRARVRMRLGGCV
jgi:hypothetical protein